MRVPLILGAMTSIVVACTVTPPLLSHGDWLSSNSLVTSSTSTNLNGVTTSTTIGTTAMPIAPPVLSMPVPAPVIPMTGWPDMSLGILGPKYYDLTTFDGPASASAGPIVVRASGGSYDSCANDYKASAQFSSGSGDIRLTVTVQQSSRRCFAAGTESSHTFEFPIRLDVPGTFPVRSMSASGWRDLGSITVH